MQKSPTFNLRRYAHQMSEELDRFAKLLHHRDVTSFVTHVYHNDARAISAGQSNGIDNGTDSDTDLESTHSMELVGPFQDVDPDIKIEPVSVMEENAEKSE